MGRIRRAAITFLLATLALPSQEPTYKVDVRLVRMSVTVKNAQGQLVGGLGKSDFLVTDNGVPQEISVFERETKQPLSIALLVDTSGSTRRERRYEFDAVRRFLKAVLKGGNPKDSVSLYSFNTFVTQETPYTRNFDFLDKQLGSLVSEGGTSVFDAVSLAAGEAVRRDGRHVLVVISDGSDTASRLNFDDALKSLHRANAVLYTVLVVPIKGDAGRNLRGENALTTLGQWTGGQIFVPALNATLDDAFTSILNDLRTQYLLGYYPKDVPTTKDAFHRVSVKVDKPGFTVSARNGYYAAAIP